MKSFVKGTTIGLGLGLAATLAYRAIEEGRRRLGMALDRAETVADRTRAAVEEVESALHDARTTL